MRLRFEMSGMPGSSTLEALVTDLDDSELPAAERRALHETVEAVRSGDDAGLAADDHVDGVTYRLELDDGVATDGGDGGSGEIVLDVVYDDRSLPVDLMPLIDFLRDRAIEERIERNRRP